jgi:hypothetical protein
MRMKLLIILSLIIEILRICCERDQIAWVVRQKTRKGERNRFGLDLPCRPKNLSTVLSFSRSLQFF